jgi:pilus assembly protein Flp/PilA
LISAIQGDPEMKIDQKLLKNLFNDDSGQDLIEYALVAALLALSALAAMSPLANKIANEFNTVGNSL